MVQLSGFVRSQTDIDNAVQVAGAIAGVKSLKNDMRIKCGQVEPSLAEALESLNFGNGGLPPWSSPQ